MNLHRKLLERDARNEPICVCLVGAGKFATMFLSQAKRTPGIEVRVVADINVDKGRKALLGAGWNESLIKTNVLPVKPKLGQTLVTDNVEGAIGRPDIDVVIEATGNPCAGVHHALRAIDNGKHIIMVNVEADALAGPVLNQRAREAGVIYSLAWGDQPALICEMVDWARASGFRVTAAGKGTKYLPSFHDSTPDTVWDHYGLSSEAASAGGMNPKMFNSFLDGTKSAIEMAAVSNATGLHSGKEGLIFPPCHIDDLPEVLGGANYINREDNGGVVEVVSSLNRDGSPIERDLRWGVYTVFEAEDDYVERCFSEYGLKTDTSGKYAAMYKPYHLIGLELGISVASVCLRGEPTGAPDSWNSDVVAVAKKDLRAGEILDGEGGFTVWGKLSPASDSLQQDALPLGLTEGCKLKEDVKKGQIISRLSIEDSLDPIVTGLRREMAKSFEASSL